MINSLRLLLPNIPKPNPSRVKEDPWTPPSPAMAAIIARTLRGCDVEQRVERVRRQRGTRGIKRRKEMKKGDPVPPRETAYTNTSTVVATLLDSGNFILQQVNSMDGSRNQILWQSFDHPIDTLYPGMKLGVNHRNGHILSLTSWSSEYDPKPGPFTLEWDYKTQELQIKRRGVVHWTSGASTSKRFKLLMGWYNFNIVSNKNEDYFSLNQTSTSQWFLTTAGVLDDLEGDVIARPDNCYGYNRDGGCKRWAEKPTCRHVGDTFEIKNGFNSNSTFPTDSNRSLSLSDCKDCCWKNCDCFGFNFLFEYYTGINWEFITGFSSDTTLCFYMLKTKSPRNNADIYWHWYNSCYSTTSCPMHRLLCTMKTKICTFRRE
ncbi:hypothetical protein ACFX19_004349 [Malus domestica]